MTQSRAINNIAVVHYPVRVSQDEKPWTEELVIAYKPFHNNEKWLESNFSEWNNWKPWLAIIFVLGFFILNGPGLVTGWLESLGVSQHTAATTFGSDPVSTTGTAITTLGAASSTLPVAAPAANLLPFTSAQVVEWFAIFTCLGVAGTLVAVARKPTHIVLTQHGIAWEWRRSLFSYGRRIPWQAISHIGLTWPNDRTSPQDCLLTFSTAEDPNAMQIKLGGIATTEQREQFLKSLEKWAPDISKDAEIFDVLTPPADHSYTELWLQALSAPPKREKLTPLISGATLDEQKYEIVEQLGVGGQGTAYLSKAKDGGDVVLKEFILPVYVDINVRRQALERMQNEVEMLKRLDNERIVKLKDFFIEDHRGYLVLERIDGDSLRTIVNNTGPMSERHVTMLLEQMCDTLEYLHSLTPPVVHRDFTPDNLILGSDGVLKLVDFNVAQQKDVTATGTVVGKHAYIPPEQFRGKPNPQSDIYAMGASLFFLLTGEDPEPISSSHPKQHTESVSEGMDHIVAKATALDCNYRYKVMTEIRNDMILLLPPRS